VLPDPPGRGVQRQPGLTAAARAGQRDQVCVIDQAVYLSPSAPLRGTKLVSSTGRLCRCASSERSGGDSAGRSVVQLSHALSGSQVIQSPRPQRDRRLDLKSLVTALPLARLGGALQVRRSWILYMVDDHLVVLVVDAGIVATSTSGKTPREPRSLPAPSSIGVELWISPARRAETRRWAIGQ
jgi:hypothetical protein